MSHFSSDLEQGFDHPWQHPSSLPKADFKTVLLYALVLLLATLALPLCSISWFALSAWVFLSALSFLLCKKKFFGSIINITVSVLLMSFSPTFGFLFMAASLGIMSGAYLMSAGRNYWFPTVISVVSFAVSFAILGDWKVALLAFFLLPAELLLTAATKNGEYRVTAICVAAGGLLISFFVLLSVLLYQSYGKIDLAVAKQALLLIQNNLLLSMQQFRTTLLSGVNETTTSNAEFIERYLSDEALTDYVLYFTYLIPAAVVVLCSVVSFLSQKMLNAAYETTGFQRAIPPQAEFFTVSVFAAILFTFSFVLSCFTSPISVAGAVMMNLELILLPAMCVIGLRRLRYLSNRKNIGIAIALALFGICSGQLFYLLGLYGAYGRVAVAVRAKMSQNHQE